MMEAQRKHEKTGDILIQKETACVSRFMQTV